MKKLLQRLVFLACVAVGTSALSLASLDNLFMPYLVNVAKVRVPELKKFTVSQALKRLRRRGLRLAMRDSLYHETTAAGVIIDQTPEVGKQIKKGRRVFVDISRGPRLYAVPKVKQVSLREARLQLEGTQLQVGGVAHKSSSDFPEGAIIEQMPREGVLLPRNSRVDLVISSGSPTATKRVPNLVGLSIEVVEDTLVKYEMRLGLLDNQVDNLRPAGIVLSQQPTAAERAMRKTPINLVLSVRETAPEELDAALETIPEFLPED